MNKQNLIAFTDQLKSADDPMSAMLEDLQHAHQQGDRAGMIWITKMIMENNKQGKEIKPVSAVHYLQEEPPVPEQILVDTFDLGDKIVVIGGSKQRKSFFILQMAISLAAGLDFLIWKNRAPRRVLLVQFEVKEDHYHKRVRNMADVLDVSEENIKDNLQIINARGLGINGADGIMKLTAIANEHRAEFIIFDPLYKIMDGNENSPEAFKPVLDAFDSLAEETGAAIGYVHHDAKGAAGDRDIRDRGAGSNVLGRDYDACITLSPHRSEENVTVVETLVRNYRYRPAFCIEWIEISSSRSCFVSSPDVDPIKETKASKKKSNNIKQPIPSFQFGALELVKDNPLPVSVFREQLRQQLKMTVAEAKAFVDWATDPGQGKLAIYEDRGRGKNIKLIGLPDHIEQLHAKKDV